MEDRHYSTQTGHRERSLYWQEVRRVTKPGDIVTKLDIAKIVKRRVIKSRKDGK